MSENQATPNTDNSDEITPDEMVAGWYPAPYEIGFERYWDGDTWTEERREVSLVNEEELILLAIKESNPTETDPAMRRMITVLIGALVAFAMAIGGLFFLTSQFVNQ